MEKEKFYLSKMSFDPKFRKRNEFQSCLICKWLMRFEKIAEEKRKKKYQALIREVLKRLYFR